MSEATSGGLTKPKPAKMTPEEQLAAFQKAARELGTDDDPERFKATVRKLGSAKPVPNASKPKAKAD